MTLSSMERRCGNESYLNQECSHDYDEFEREGRYFIVVACGDQVGKVVPQQAEAAMPALSF